MKVEIEMKITVLEGEEAGRTFTQKTVGETEPQITEYGVIERLRLEWNYIHDDKEEEK